MSSHILRHNLGPSRSLIRHNQLLSISHKPFAFLQSPRHSFFTTSSPRLMDKDFDAFTRRRLQRASRSYHSSRGPDAFSGRSGVMPAFWFLFGANALVFGAINYAKYTKDRRLEAKLLGHTLLSPASWDRGRWYTILTSAFAHIDPFHFGFNMLSLYNFCTLCAWVPGMNGLHIFAIAAGSAISGGLGFLWHRKNQIREAQGNWQMAARNYNSSALGASGAVMGVGAVTACLIPKAPVQLMLIPISFPLWVFVAGYGLVDSFFLNSPTSSIAHAGHLGGLFFGTVYYLALLRKAPTGIWGSLSRYLGSTKR